MHRLIILAASFAIIAISTHGARANHCLPEIRELTAQMRSAAAQADQARAWGDLAAACKHATQAVSLKQTVYAVASRPQCGHASNPYRAPLLQISAISLQRMKVRRQQYCATASAGRARPAQ